MNKVGKKNRYDEIDVLRSIGIILMIMGHIRFGDTFESCIHTFHVQLFFIISGFLFTKKNISYYDFVQKKVRSLLLPYLSFGLFHLAIKGVFSINNPKEILQYFMQLFWINTASFPIAGALWFLTSLFFMYVIYYWIVKIQKTLLKHLVVAVIVIVGYIAVQYVRLPWALDTSLCCIGLMHIGHEFKETLIRVRDKFYCFPLFLGVGIIAAIFNESVNIREGTYGCILLFYIAAICITFALYQLSYYWVNSRIPYKEMKFIGMNSIIYMSFNQLIVWIPNKIADRLTGASVWGMRVITLIVTMIILHLLACIIDKYRLLRFLSGKK